MVRTAAATLPPARVTAAEEPSDPATNPTASPVANSWNGRGRDGRHSRMETRVAAIVARHSTTSDPTRRAGYGRYTEARGSTQPPPRGDRPRGGPTAGSR